MISYEIWLAGQGEAIELEMETDELLQAFNRWLAGADAAQLKGLCITDKDGFKLAVNFAQVAGMKVIASKDKPKKKVGFV